MKRCQTCNKITDDDRTLCPDDRTPLAEDTLATSLQQALGAKYTLTKLIGKGAMGAVYRARHRDLDDVAIKVMLGPTHNVQLSERFLREAKALRRLRHQHAVTIYDLDRAPGITYMVMEMVEGGSLRQDLRERSHLSLAEVMEVAEAVCGALSAAHDRGIIHRDLKPDNILVAEEVTVTGRILRTIKIADFGIVKLRGSQRDGEASMKLTQVGTPIGTPFYMSPEQWFGDGGGINALDGRTDIYALGCTLYELLSGRTPFMGRTTSELRRQHLEHPPIPLFQIAPHVPEEMSRVIMRTLEKDRDDRPATAAEFFAELRNAYNSYNESDHVTAVARREDLFPREHKHESEAQPTDVQIPRQRDTKEALLLAADTQKSEEARRAEEARLAEEARRAEEAREAEEISRAEEAREAEEARRAAEQEAHPASIVGYESTQVNERPVQTQPDLTDTEITVVHRAASGSEPWANQVGTGLSVADNPPRRRMSRRAWMALVALLLIGAGVDAAGVGVYLYRQRMEAAETRASRSTDSVQTRQSFPMANMPTGTLRINAPQGSDVFLDDEKAGTIGPNGEFNTLAPSGVRNVRIIASGYRPWVKDVGVTTNLTTALTPDFKRPLVAAKNSTDEERRSRAGDFFRGKNYYAAEIEYRELLKASPNEAPLHISLAEALNAQKRYTEAIVEYEAAARLDPKNVDTLGSLGSLYSIKGRDAEAEATFRKAVKLAPKEADAHNSLAWVLQRSADKLDEALAEVEEALKIKRGPDYLDTKAYILIARNALDEALKTEQRAAALDKNRDPMFRAGMAVILYRMGRTDEAISTYRELRQANPAAEWGDIKRLEMLRGYSRPVLETFAALITRTN